ncbi:MAG: beta-galactosidase trimerization domain-containing protein [Lentisphaeria bacterium]|nr:beta-galactosidase trimerization domain-containing protein [Lentisphaeria bacterium]
MTRHLLPAVLLAAATLGAAKLPVFNYTFTAKTLADDKNPGINDDPGFRKLTDGKINVDGSKIRYGKVLFRHVDNKRQPVVITFNFRDEVKLSEAKIHYFRWHRSYGIKAVRLIGVRKDGSRIPMGSVTLNHPYTKPKEDPHNMAAVIKSEDNSPVKSIDVVFTATGGYLALNEIEFFGDVVKSAEKPALASNPLDKFATAAKPGFRLYQADGQYVLENDQVIYGIDPRYSGSVNYAYDKSAKCNLILYSAPGSGYGPFFNDRFYPGGSVNRDMYRYLTYKAEVLADTPERKQLRMTGFGKSGFFANVKIEKVFTLEKNSSLLRADYTITNGLDNVVPLDKGFWTYGGVQVPEGYRRVVPGLNGVEVTPASAQLVARDIAAGWYGIEAANRGLAFIVPWERLKEIYYWAGNEYTGTVECKLGIYPVKAGDSLRFSMSMTPFDRIGVPDKVTDFAAGGFNLAPEYPQIPAELSFKARLTSPGSCDVRISGGLLRNGKVTFKPVASGKISGTHGEVKFKAIRAKGTVVYRAELCREGKVLFSADAAASFGGATTGLYAQVLPGVKIKDSSPDDSKLNLNFNSTAFATPHIKWAKPYAGGKIKVLAVNTVTGGIRDMIEMAQRFDLDLTTNYIAGLWSLSGHTTSLNQKSCVNILARQLKKDYDLYIVTHNAWEIIGKENSAAILEKVAQGAGLIMTEPVDFPTALNKFLVLNRKKGVPQNAEKWSGSFCGIDAKLLPATRIRCFDKLGTEVFAKAGKFPLAGSFDYGKGKVFALAWIASNPGGRNSKYNVKATFFLPQMSYGPEAAIPQFDYYEYQMAFLGKLFCAAAKKKSAVTKGTLAAVPGKLTLALDASEALDAEIAVTVRDKFSAPTGSVKVKKSLKKGENTCSVELPAQDLAGFHIADVIVSGPKGTLWWGAATFDNPAPAQIRTVKVPEKIFKKSEKLPVEVTFTGDAKVKLALFDIYGNEFFRAEGPKAELSLADCRTPIARLTAELVKDGKVVDRAKLRIELFQPPVPSRMNIAQGWPGVGSKSQLAFIPQYLSQLKKFGITCTSGSTSSRDVMTVERRIRDSGITYLSTVVNVGNGGVGGKRPFDTTKKPKDKFDLIRKPCLSAPGFKENLGKVTGMGHSFPYGAMSIPGPDEANMIGEWDGCFSPHCQKEFRNWLKKVYPSLKALNDSWDTDFKSWDEVIALTANEARQKKSFAGWLDHRTFNDWNRADAFRIMITAMAKATGGLPYSLSGTSETSPWNAWDYYLLMPYLKTLAAYSGEQTIQHRSFAPHRVASMPWIGYDASGDSSHQKILFNLMNGATGFNIYGNFNIAPDFQLSPKGKELIAVLDLYRNGPGEAIMRMNTKTYPIAFLYSPASIKLDWIIGLANQRSSSTAGFRQMVHDAGLVYDYVAYGQLEKSGVPEKYQVIFLPMTAALSDKEAAALEAFVDRGGILVGDFLSGTYDAHGRKRAVPALNKVFGISSKGLWERKEVTVTGAGPLKGLGLKTGFVETGIAPVTAKVIGLADGKPAIFENSFGKGRAIYFGVPVAGTFGDWKEMRYSKNNAPSTKAIDSFMTSLFQSRGIRPFAAAPTLQGTSLLLREAGEGVILATLRDISQTALLDKKAAKHTIRLAEKRHIYDMLKHTYLGYGDSFVYEYTPVTQGVFALLPYKARGIDVRFTADGAELTLLADAKKFADHTFHVELLDGTGKSDPAFDDVVLGKGNKGFYKFRKPLNARGRWKLRVTEALTSQSRTVDLP